MMAFFLFSEVRVSGSTPIVIGAEGGAKKPSEMMAFFIVVTQYFESVPEVARNFYIGGYLPAQKWLKDRKDRELQIDEIRHYLKIIAALKVTDRVMKEIDKSFGL